MKVDTLAHVKNSLSSVITSLGGEPLFITRNGKVAAVLQAITDEDAEDYLLRNSPKFWKLIAARRAAARRGETRPFHPEAYGSAAAAPMAVRDSGKRYGTTKARRRRADG